MLRLTCLPRLAIDGGKLIPQLWQCRSLDNAGGSPWISLVSVHYPATLLSGNLVTRAEGGSKTMKIEREGSFPTTRCRLFALSFLFLVFFRHLPFFRISLSSFCHVLHQFIWMHAFPLEVKKKNIYKERHVQRWGACVNAWNKLFKKLKRWKFY